MEKSHKVTHEEIDQVPYQVKARYGSEQQHDTTGEDAIDGHYHRTFRDEAHIRLAIIVVADDGGVGKEEDGNGYEDGTGTAHFRL